MEHILIIDDDADMCKLLQRFLSKSGYEVTFAQSGKKGLESIELQKPDLVLCDFRLGDTDGKSLLLAIKEKEPSIQVIIITGYSDIRMAVDVMKHGAFDYVTKPLLPEEILLTIKKALSTDVATSVTSINSIGNKTGKTIKATTNNEINYKGKYIFSNNGVFGEIMNQVKLVAPTDYSVIIYGESGCGKESVAEKIHEQSNRNNKPFIAIDCGALSKELAGSELFGHEKGSFTGAVIEKTGSLELANGGTVFLDEVANLPYDVQVMLLRVVQERKMKKIGGNKEIDLDIRIIVASNELLYESARKGKFREDLYHRFNEFGITIPPLRERKDDILLFANFFLQKANAELERSITGFATAVEKLFLTYQWPGNLREMKNVIKRAALLTTSEFIELSALPFELVNYSKLLFDINDLPGKNDDKKNNMQNNLDEKITRRDQLSASDNPLKAASIDGEYEAIVMALKKVNYNKSKAAKILNIDRKTLYNKMRQYKEFNEL